eukprot:SM000240S08614  [mRNA]  locus=s240:142350:148769:+ [translate_table: standard]
MRIIPQSAATAAPVQNRDDLKGNPGTQTFGSRTVLLELRRHITKDPTGYLSGWNATTDPCTDAWNGVKCCVEKGSSCEYWPGGAGSRLRVTALYLGSQYQPLDLKLEGTLPPHLSSLKWLTQIDFSNNRLTGTLPLLPGLSNRLQMAASRESVCGGSQFLGFSSRHLHERGADKGNHLVFSTTPACLSGEAFCNQCSSTLSPRFELAVCRNVSFNNFEGLFPEDLSCPPLSTMNVANNNFTGNIPAQIVQDLSINAVSEDEIYIKAQLFPTFFNEQLNKASKPTNQLGAPPGTPATSQMNVRHKAAALSALAIAAIAIGAVILTAIAAGILTRRIPWRTRQEQQDMDGDLNQELPLVQDEGQLFSYEALRRATNNFSLEQSLPSGDRVAVKVLHPTGDQRHRQVEYTAEVAVLSRIHHRNLVKILGHCTHGSHQILVYELKEQGSLYDRLRGPQRTKSWLLFVGVKQVFGTPGYVAPEVTQGKVGYKADVWSFGVVFLELVTGLRSISNDDMLLQARVALAKNEVEKVLDKRINSTVNISEARDMLLVAMACLASTANDRPSMRAVVQYLCGTYPPPLLHDVMLSASTSTYGMTTSSLITDSLDNLL